MKPYFEIHVNRAAQRATLTESYAHTEVCYHAFVSSHSIDEYFSKETKSSVTAMRRLIKRRAKAGGSDARNYVERYKI